MCLHGVSTVKHICDRFLLLSMSLVRELDHSTCITHTFIDHGAGGSQGWALQGYGALHQPSRSLTSGLCITRSPMAEASP